MRRSICPEPAAPADPAAPRGMSTRAHRAAARALEGLIARDRRGRGDGRISAQGGKHTYIHVCSTLGGSFRVTAPEPAADRWWPSAADRGGGRLRSSALVYALYEGRENVEPLLRAALPIFDDFAYLREIGQRGWPRPCDRLRGSHR